MQRFEHTVKDPVGIHARPAGLLVKFAQSLGSDISLECRGKSADAKKILAVMGLGAKCGDLLTVCVTGQTEKHDSDLIKEFLEKNV